MAETPSTMVPLGIAAPAFRLADTAGNMVSLADAKGAPVLVMFICNHCPFVQHIRGGLAAFAREYQSRGLKVMAINSNDVDAYPADSPANMSQEVERYGYTFPYLYDGTQQIAKAYGAACTPDFFLFDREHRLVYRGQFDDSRPSNGKPVSGADLRAAADAVLAGRAAPSDQRPSIGCNIKWKRGNEPEYFGRR